MVLGLANGSSIGGKNMNTNTFIRNGKLISMADKNGIPATKQQVKDMGEGMMNWMGLMGLLNGLGNMGIGMDDHKKNDGRA